MKISSKDMNVIQVNPQHLCLQAQDLCKIRSSQFPQSVREGLRMYPATNKMGIFIVYFSSQWAQSQVATWWLSLIMEIKLLIEA